MSNLVPLLSALVWSSKPLLLLGWSATGENEPSLAPLALAALNLTLPKFG